MVKFIRQLTAVFVILILALPAAGDLFIWTDRDGVRHFSNIAPPRDADNAEILEKEVRNQIPSDRQFRVIKVYDGDSLLVKGLDLRFKIRMVGIDAPETGGRHKPGQPYSRKSHLYLSRRVQDRSVTLKTYGLDRYNRVLAEVFTGETNINLEMVKMGMAEVYKGGLPPQLDAAPYLTAQDRARRSRTGMWAQDSRYKSPRQWRKENPRN